MEKDIKFPKGFFWGSATSSYQVEGGINNNDWAQAAKEGLVPDAGRACDHFNRYKEDFDIAKSLGQNAHRFSLEWARIEPEEGKFDESAIKHYRDVIAELKSRDIEPFVTLWHWTLPLWVVQKGGWLNGKTIDFFLVYVNKILDSFGNEIKFFIPINEPTVYTGHAYIIGIFPPKIKNYIAGNKVLKNLLTAHRKTYALIHKKLGPDVKIGIAHNLHWHLPYRQSSPFDRLAARILDYVRDNRSLDWAKGYEDFIGLNYYYRDCIKFSFNGRGKFGLIDIKNPNQDVSDIGWDIAPEGIYWVLKKLKPKKLPIYITENGIADSADKKRGRYIKTHLEWAHKAIEDGVDVRGYFHWSLLDNFEWAYGFSPRFGLVEIDYQTMERRIRPSAYFYRDVCLENGITGGIVEKHKSVLAVR